MRKRERALFYECLSIELKIQIDDDSIFSYRSSLDLHFMWKTLLLSTFNVHFA